MNNGLRNLYVGALFIHPENPDILLAGTGKAFARVLEELWTDVSPMGAYWNPTRILSDNRIAAFAADSSTCTFGPAAEGKITVEVVLIFRRAFIDLALQKGWQIPDIVMEKKVISIPSP